MEGAHHAVDHNDSFGKKVGVQTAILAVFLSVFTICAHRAHTKTIIKGNESSNRWAHYQAKRSRDFQLEMNTDLLKLAAPKGPEVDKVLADYAKQRAKYGEELEGIKKEAEKDAQEGESAHHKALYFDLSEGVLEIGLVLSSLYFLSHKKFFPILGLAAGLAGLVAGAYAFLVH